MRDRRPDRPHGVHGIHIEGAQPIFGRRLEEALSYRTADVGNKVVDLAENPRGVFDEPFDCPRGRHIGGSDVYVQGAPPSDGFQP